MNDFYLLIRRSKGCCMRFHMCWQIFHRGLANLSPHGVAYWRRHWEVPSLELRVSNSSLRWWQRSHWAVRLCQAAEALCTDDWDHVTELFFLFPVWLKVIKFCCTFNFGQIFEQLQVFVEQVNVLNFFLIFAQWMMLLHRWSHHVGQVGRPRHWKPMSVIDFDKATDHSNVSYRFLATALHALELSCAL